MYRGKVVSAVVPAYLEESLIGETIRGMPGYVDHIVVVDDASPDRTAEVAAGVGDPRVEVVRLEQNQGVGGAIVTGHLRALELGSDINAVLAGDNQMDPSQLERLLDPIIDDGYGFTKGNRFFSHGSMEGMPAHRVVGNMALTFMNKAASGYWNIVDPQNGYTAITRESLASIPLDRLSKRYEFENDLLIWLNIANVRARDINIAARYGAETSSIRLRTFVPRISSLLFRGFWRRMWLKHMLWSFSPIGLMLLSGLASLLFGLGVGLWVTSVALGGQTPTAGTTVLAVVPFFCGFILLVQAMVLDIQATPG